MPWQCGMMLRLQFNNRVALSPCNRPVHQNQVEAAVPNQLHGLGTVLGFDVGSRRIGVAVDTSWFTDLWQVSIARVAPVVPYLLLVLVLALRPRGLMGTRST